MFWFTAYRTWGVNYQNISHVHNILSLWSMHEIKINPSENK